MAIAGVNAGTVYIDVLPDTSRFESQMRGLGSKLTSVGKRATLGVTLPLVGIGIAAVKTSAEFQRSVNTMAAVAQVPQDELEELRDLAIDLGAKTVFSANDAAQAMVELAKAGIAPAQIQAGALANTLDLATAGDLDLASAATIAANAMNVFGLSGKDSKIAVDALAGAANASSADVSDLAQALAQGGLAAANANLSVQETTAVLGAFADAGLKGSDAGTSLKTFLLSLVPTTDKAKDAMNDLNLSFVDAEGNIKPITDIAQQLQDKLGGLTQAQQQTALKTIFGTDAFRAASVVMKEGRDGLLDYIEATDKTGTASEVAAAKMEGLPGAIETLKGSIETALLVLGDALAPIVEAVAGFITNVLNKFTELPPVFKTIAVVLGIVAAAAGPVLLIIGGIASGIAALAPVIGAISLPVVGVFLALAAAGLAIWRNWDKVQPVIQAVVDGFKRLLPTIKQVAGVVANTLVKAWNTLLTDVFPAIARGFATVVKVAQRFWKSLEPVRAAIAVVAKIVAGTVVEAFHELAGLWDTLVDVWNSSLKPALQDLWDALMILWDPVLKAIAIAVGVVVAAFVIFYAKAIPLTIRVLGILIRIIGTVIRVFAAIIKGVALVIQFLARVVTTIGAFLANAASKFVSFVDFLRNLPARVGAIFIGIYNTVRQWITKAATWITDQWNKIVRFFASLPGRLARAGSGMFDWIVDAAKSIAGAVVSAINFIIGLINKIQVHIHLDPPGPGSINFDWNGPNIPYLAKGGVLMGPTMFMGGEGGEPEAVVPLSRLETMINRDAAQPWSGPITIQIGREKFEAWVDGRAAGEIEGDHRYRRRLHTQRG